MESRHFFESFQADHPEETGEEKLEEIVEDPDAMLQRSETLFKKEEEQIKAEMETGGVVHRLPERMKTVIIGALLSLSVVAAVLPRTSFAQESKQPASAAELAERMGRAAIENWLKKQQAQQQSPQQSEKLKIEIAQERVRAAIKSQEFWRDVGLISGKSTPSPSESDTQMARQALKEATAVILHKSPHAISPQDIIYVFEEYLISAMPMFDTQDKFQEWRKRGGVSAISNIIKEYKKNH